MARKWEKLYKQAVEEEDPEKALEACELARRAILDCLLESPPPTAAGQRQRERLREAARTLFLHEQKFAKPKRK